MSTFYTRQVTCPGCRVPIDAWLARGVHAARRGDLRDEILARRFHRCSCAACGVLLEVEHPMVYTDVHLHQWLYVGTASDRSDWAAWEARLAADVACVFAEHSPLIHELRDHLRYRVVFGYEELREKLVIWRAGLDDALVECVKLRALATDPGLGVPGSRLVVDRVDPDGRTELRWFADGAVTPERAAALPPAWLADADRDRASLAARLPELFRGGYVSFRRFLDATPTYRPSPRSDADRT